MWYNDDQEFGHWRIQGGTEVSIVTTTDARRVMGLLVPLAAIVALFSSAASVLAEDCNNNGVPDIIDIASGTSLDCNALGVPDECEVPSAQTLFAADVTYGAGSLPQYLKRPAGARLAVIGH